MPDKNSDTANRFLENIEGSELIVYLNDGGQFVMDLTNRQLGVAFLALGFRMLDNESYTVFSNEMLAKEVSPELQRLTDEEWCLAERFFE